jgi:hypothetical protein
MIMAPRARKFAFTAHVTSSVGWIGAVVAFQTLAIAALRNQDPESVRGLYLAMELIGWRVVVPFCLASLVTGLVMSLGTPWGLFRHYWVLAKFLITIIAALILLGFTQTLATLGSLAADPTLSLGELRNLRQSPALHSGGGLLVLLLTTFIAVYKPWGMTPLGRRRAMAPPSAGSVPGPVRRPYLLLAFLGLLLVFLVLHLLQGGPMRH